MHKVDTYTANIYCGLEIGYNSYVLMSINDVKNICTTYVNEHKLCVTITETEFVYVNGNEPGVIIGLINYPRFPSEPYKIKHHAICLAEILKEKLMQQRISIVCTDETIMLGER